MNQRSALTLSLLVVCLLLIPFSPGLNIAPFLALTVMVAWMRERCSSAYFFAATAILAALSYTTAQVLYPTETNSALLNSLISLEKPVLLIIFSGIFFYFYPQKINNIGGILSICALVFLLEEAIITFVLTNNPPYGNIEAPAGNPYIYFSPGQEMYETVISEAKLRAAEIANKDALQNFSKTIELVAFFQATSNIIANIFYMLVFTLLLGRIFLKIRFNFTTLRLPSIVTYILLLLWGITLLIFQDYLLLPNLAKHFLYSAMVVLSVLHFLQGLAIVLFKIFRVFFLLQQQEKKNITPSSSFLKRPSLLKISFFAVLLLFPLLFVGNPVGLISLPISISLLGVIDLWFNYRKI